MNVLPFQCTTPGGCLSDLLFAPACAAFSIPLELMVEAATARLKCRFATRRLPEREPGRQVFASGEPRFRRLPFDAARYDLYDSSIRPALVPDRLSIAMASAAAANEKEGNGSSDQRSCRHRYRFGTRPGCGNCPPPGGRGRAGGRDGRALRAGRRDYAGSEALSFAEIAMAVFVDNRWGRRCDLKRWPSEVR